jgi:hypothetical protein
MTPRLVLFVMLGLLATATLHAEPPAGGAYVITKSTIDNGGGVSSGGNFVVTGSIGQPDASLNHATGGGYTVAGGFWSGTTSMEELIFADGFE